MRWWSGSALILALSLAVCAPLICIIHCTLIRPGSADQGHEHGSSADNPATRFICYSHSTHEAPSGPQLTPQAYYELVLDMSRLTLPGLSIVAIVLLLIDKIVRSTSKAPPTPPPRSDLGFVLF